MEEINIGDLVRMTEKIKEQLMNNDSIEHVEEFGNCEGIVIGYTDEGHDDYLDVRWKPSNLRYGYPVDGLEKVK